MRQIVVKSVTVVSLGMAMLLGGATAGTTTSTATAVAEQQVAGDVRQVPANPVVEGAIAWSQERLGQVAYEGLCLRFVVDAYVQGGGVDIGTGPSAVEYWDQHAAGQHPGDTAAPRGALVFWGATSANPYGHVGISLGDGTVISSYERSDHTIHTFAIADRNAAGYPYLGWISVA